MKRVWRNGGRVLSAILAAAMIFTCLPVSRVTVYADEVDAQVITEETADAIEAAAEDETAADETAAEEIAPAENETPVGDDEYAADSEAPTDDGTPAEGETPADEETPGNDEGSSGGESSTEDEDLPVDSDPMILEDSALEELAALDDEAAYASSTEEINLALAEDYTWDEDGTTITGLAKEYTWDQYLTLRIPAKATRIASGAFKKDNSSSLTIIALSFQGDNILIEDSAFYGARLEQITLPGGTTFSGGSQFYNCQFLTDITLENGITEIPEYAFYNECNLKEIVIPNSVTVIGAHAFDSCSKLATVNPSNCLREIRDNAFQNCKSLEWFSIPTSVEMIGSEAFQYSGLKALNITAENVTYGDRAFAYCSSLSTVVFKGLQAVSPGMFMSCTNLTRVELPEGLETIGYYAFSGCSALSDIDLPDTVTSLGGLAAFSGTNITAVTIPASVTGDIYAFGGCTSLQTIRYAEGRTEIPGWHSGIYGGDDNNNVREVVLPSTTEVIKTGAFQNFTNLTEINLPDNLTEIGYSVFEGCSSLTEIRLPDNIQYIWRSAFEGCTSLARINLPESLKTIGETAFKNCSSLTDIQLPDSLVQLGEQAFSGCTGLTQITIPAKCYIYGDDPAVFEGCINLTYLEYAEGTYSIDPVGATYAETVVFPSSANIIQTNAFKGYTHLTTISDFDNIWTIRSNAFGPGEDADGNKVYLDQIQEIRYGGYVGNQIDIADDAFDGTGNSRQIPVYCQAGSSFDEYFSGKKGFRVMATYSIWYDLDGGTNDSRNPNSYTSGDDLTFYNPTREGYVFGGWYTDWRLTKPFVYDKNSTHGDLDLYAKWNEISYTITYDLDGGTLPKGKTNPATYVPSKDVTLISPTKANALFSGWQVNGTDTILQDKKIPANTYAQDLTLTAQWRENSYSLAFDKNAKDATGSMNTRILNYTETYTIPEEGYTRPGYDFIGWNTKANGKGTAYYEGDVVSSLSDKLFATVTLYAQWQKSIYEIVYVMNDSEVSPATNNKSNPDSCSVGQTVTLKAPTRTGYTFNGWYTDAVFSDDCKVTKVTSAMGDVTLYAKWTPITYTITFNKNKGTLPAGAAMDNITATYDQAEPLPANAFIRIGYTFLGWDLTAASKSEEPAYMDGAEVSNLSRKNKAKVTLYARWQVNQIPITYVLNDTKEDPATNPAKNPAYVTIEKNVVLSAPTRAGYKFGGWYTDEALETPLAKNTIAKTTTDPVTVYASWTSNSYTLKLDKNGGTYDIPREVDGKLVVGKHEYEDEFLLPDGTGASRTNYEFTGWNTQAKGTGDAYADEAQVSRLIAKNKGKVTLYAQWQAIEYTITYDGAEDGVDGVENTNPTTYTIEQDVKLVNPTAYGYTFKGWYAEDLSVNPKAKKVTKIAKATADDVTVYASWSENRYNLRFSTNSLFGSSVKSVTNRLYTDGFNLPTATPKEGYTFQGWALTRDGKAIFHAGDTVTFADIHEAGGTAKGLVGTKYFTLYAVFVEE